MSRVFASLLAGAALSGGLLASPPAAADTLLLDHSRQASAAAVPTRGMSMADVEARFGAPAERLDPRGGQTRQWPTINRWVYPAFTVYFEQDRVIHTVANRATALETGPRPVIR